MKVIFDRDKLLASLGPAAAIAPGRKTIASVEGILNRWIADRDGLIREYERNKYMIIFEARHLEALCESRFSVMDEIHTVRVGES